MADLHKFGDDAVNQASEPIESRHLDENFKACRTQVGGSASSLLRIDEDFPQPDKLELNVPKSGLFIPYFNNGAPSLLSIPTSGIWYIRIENGVVGLIERGACES